MNLLQKATAALLSGLATKNEDGSINWERKRIILLDSEKQMYMVEYHDGDKQWFLNNQTHSEGGPALEWADGNKEWWINGNLHREDGPAVEWSDGSKEWYLNGVWYTKKQWRKKVKDEYQK